MEGMMDPDRQREVLLTGVLALVKREEVRKSLARQVVGMSWNLAESEIKYKEEKNETVKVKIDSLTEKLNETELGKGVLKLKNEMVEAISNDREKTRIGLAEYLRTTK